MLKEHEIAALMRGVSTVVRDYVASAAASAMTAFNTRHDGLEAKLAAIPVGPRGEKGDPGECGETGKEGPRGGPGETGGEGKAGPPGAKGDPGERGETGGIGHAPGAEGEPGIAGKDGNEGPPGKPGDQGPSGLSGPEGKPGPQGAPGPAGLAGKDGERGAIGERGIDGRDGREGKDGDPGRDALEVEPLLAIDESKSYPRGTWAMHRGGLIRAVRATDPFAPELGGLERAGWAVVLNGVHLETEEALDEGRTIRRSTEYTSGRAFVRESKTSAIVYRGVWREGTFERGDTATWGGSVWHCEGTTTDKPGTSAAWKLMVKSGRDGKSFDAPAKNEPVSTVRLK